MNVHKLLDKLANIKKTGDSQWIACCPAHDDNNPSLSVAYADGTTLINCHAGCRAEVVLSAVGLSWRDLNGQSVAGNGSQAHGNKHIYPYEDETGKLLFQVIRGANKTFKCRRPSKEGWTYNLKGVRKVPYRLPEVVSAEAVIICEGEKDVETLREFGYIATCNPHGAGKWTKKYSELLAGKHVTIIPDNDEPGLSHAIDVARSTYGIAASVAILRLPLEKKGADVSDYFADGHSKDDFVSLLERTEDWTPTVAQAVDNATDQSEHGSILNVRSVNEWMNLNAGKKLPSTLFGEFWYENEVCILVGDTGKGKSILGVQIGDSISRGSAIHPFTLEAGKKRVLYLDFELSDVQFRRRYSFEQDGYVMKTYQFSDYFLRAEIHWDMEKVTDEESLSEMIMCSIAVEIERFKPEVVIVDNLTFLRADNEKAKDALGLMVDLMRLKRRYHLSMLVLTHTPKKSPFEELSVNHIAGSKMISNFADSVFAIGESAKDPQERYLKQLKARSIEAKYGAANVPVFRISKRDNFLGLEFLRLDKERNLLASRNGEDRSELTRRVHELHQQGLTQREIADELGIAASTVNKYLKES